MSKLGSRKLCAQTKTNNTHNHKVTIAKNDKKCEERVYNEDILEFVQKTALTLLLNLKKYLENCNLSIGECYRWNDAVLEKLC